MKNLPADIDLILVAIMPKPRDLEIARMLGWYRIPLKSAPKVIAVDYLAFYQTGAFSNDHRWKIEAIAQVRGHELTTRAALFRDEQDHPCAYEEYYKIQLGDLTLLDVPIYADSWRRITFFYTTGALMNNAKTMRDLVVTGEDRNTLWNTLRERALQESEGVSNCHEFDINLDILSLLQDWDKIKETGTGYDDLD